MSLHFFKSDRSDKSGKQYIKPSEILSDPYLTPFQKHIVLEAMLSDITDEQGEILKPNSRFADQILKAQQDLKVHLN